MAYIQPTVNEFKGYFHRDFPYAVPLDGPGDPTDYKKVMDQDIINALATARVNFNEARWEDQETYKLGYLLLSAHYLVKVVLASSQGLRGQNSGITQLKNVGSMQESYVIPDRIKNSPHLGGLYTTRYGALYLELLAPRLLGNVVCVEGATTAA